MKESVSLNYNKNLSRQWTEADLRASGQMQGSFIDRDLAHLNVNELEIGDKGPEQRMSGYQSSHHRRPSFLKNGLSTTNLKSV